MSTSCNISIARGKSRAMVCMSHDGSPDSVLRVLARALTVHGENLTSDILFEEYLSQYTHPESRKLVEQNSTPSDDYAGDWTYFIQLDGTLQVYCYEHWAEHELIHPLEYVFNGGVRRSCQAEVAVSIGESLKALEAVGVTLCELED